MTSAVGSKEDETELRFVNPSGPFSDSAVDKDESSEVKLCGLCALLVVLVRDSKPARDVFRGC